ncbi:hypothetical protein [Corticibacter populi]|nr:hypothetical protein [Corticibacter populi]RZS35497.1 hypothetical protein EV687_0565 [Corticibacter populi]
MNTEDSKNSQYITKEEFDEFRQQTFEAIRSLALFAKGEAALGATPEEHYEHVGRLLFRMKP